MRSKCYLQGKKADGVRKIEGKKAPKRPASECGLKEVTLFLAEFL